MTKETYPTAQEQLGKYLILINYFSIGDDYYKYVEKILLDYYERIKEKYSRDTEKVFCTFNKPEIICKIGNVFDPLSMGSSIAIKWTIEGRAFYIKRNFCKSILKKNKHSVKSNVPKRKRGKLILWEKKT